MKKILSLFLLLCLSFSGLAYSAEELVVYSARKEHLIKPLFEAYEKSTGIKIKYVTDKAGPLLEKLKAEGKQTEADVLITVDAGNLWHAGEEGLLAKVNSKVLEKNIPDHLRDPKKRWFGLSVRARTIVYSPERVLPTKELHTYESLSGPEWQGRLCLRTSKKVYNQSLVAMMIADFGKEETEKIVKGWVRNLAAPPFSNDTKVMEAIAAGQCDVGIVNTYYYGRLKRKQRDLKLKLFWPNQATYGVHVNVSGAGVVKYSKKKEEARRFIEWLSSVDAQNLFADSNLEYPVNPEVEANDEVKAWGTYKANLINVSKAGELQKEAIMLMDKAGYK